MEETKTIYSVVDIETTGGRAHNHKITEIAIYKFDGENVLEKYSTLINPERNIPYRITQITGITDGMVADAPKFYEVAKAIVEMTKDTVFVAHDVFFDYNIIKREFAELGYSFKLPKLCTVRLARKFIKGHKSYSLGKICKDLNIEITARLRAEGDVAATVELFKRILEVQESDIHSELVVEKSTQMALPAELNQSDIEVIPELSGIYYLKDNRGVILYIGKSLNIKKRIKSHFNISNKKEREVQLKSKVASIDHFLIPNEWVSLIIEACEIKIHRPYFNRKLNRINFKYGIKKSYEDNYLDLNTTTTGLSDLNPALKFRSRKTALAKKNSLYRDILGVDKDSLNFDKFKSLIPFTDFNQKIERNIDKQEYTFENFEINIPLPKDDSLKLFFQDNEIKSIY